MTRELSEYHIKQNEVARAAEAHREEAPGIELWIMPCIYELNVPTSYQVYLKIGADPLDDVQPYRISIDGEEILVQSSGRQRLTPKSNPEQRRRCNIRTHLGDMTVEIVRRFVGQGLVRVEVSALRKT